MAPQKGNDYMMIAGINTFFLLLLLALSVGLTVYLLILTVRALRKYLRSDAEKGASQDTVPDRLPESIKNHRLRSGMTQEFVAESLGVSRQAVSKWENGTSSPSTANLLALAKLYGISAAELLQETEQ